MLIGSRCAAAPPPEDTIKKLAQAIRKQCPEAAIEVTKDAFIAKHGTMMYTVHSRSKSGEIYPQTYQEEGPNFRGFMLRVALEEGAYAGAAAVLQTLQGPNYPTFIDAVSIAAGKKHYLIHFSYGSRLDPELMKAILDTIPATKFQRSAGDRPKPGA